MRTIQEIWHPPHGNTATLLQAAAHVVEFNDSEAATAITHYLHNRDIKIHHRPVTVIGKDATFCFYHHGSDYDVFALGDPEQILQACVLSENEREKSLLEARRLAANGVIVMAVAKGGLGAVAQNPHGISGLDLCGHISTT